MICWKTMGNFLSQWHWVKRWQKLWKKLSRPTRRLPKLSSFNKLRTVCVLPTLFGGLWCFKVIIYMKKLLDYDRLRAVQFNCNTGAKSVTPMQIKRRNSGLWFCWKTMGNFLSQWHRVKRWQKLWKKLSRMQKNGSSRTSPCEVARAISEFWKTHAQTNFKFNDLRYNDIPRITINIRLPSKRYSKMYGAEPRYTDLRYSDTPGITMAMSLTERKIFPVIRIKSISQTTGNSNIV